MRSSKRLESLISDRSIGITNSHNAALWAIQSHYFSIPGRSSAILGVFAAYRLLCTISARLTTLTEVTH